MHSHTRRFRAGWPGRGVGWPRSWGWGRARVSTPVCGSMDRRAEIWHPIDQPDLSVDRLITKIKDFLLRILRQSYFGEVVIIWFQLNVSEPNASPDTMRFVVCRKVKHSAPPLGPQKPLARMTLDHTPSDKCAFRLACRNHLGKGSGMTHSR